MVDKNLLLESIRVFLSSAFHRRLYYFIYYCVKIYLLYLANLKPNVTVDITVQGIEKI